MSEPLLKITDLRKSFAAPEGDSLAVLDVPHYEHAAGELRAIHGISGSGKTTFLHLISGLLVPTAGDIVLGGQSVPSLGEAERDAFRARNVGYVFQTFHLMEGLTARENVELPLMLAGQSDLSPARALLERVGLGDRLDYLPRQLSNGQKQRIALARALVNHPPLILADEPTGNLDPKNASESLDLMLSICGEYNAGLLLVSHDREILQRFDSVTEFSEINRRLAEPAQ